MVPTTSTTFEKMIVVNTRIFAESAAKNINAMLEVASRAKPVTFTNEGVISDQNFFVSIMFTGMVYGEYILALNSELAARLIGKSFENLQEPQKADLYQEISEFFREILNVTVGESIVSLSKVYQKITITAPRVCIGQVKYPKVRTGKSILQAKAGEIECFLYVDQMKLDIADSYKTALISVVNANKDLRAAYEQLQEQQEHLIQAEKLAALGTMAAGVAHEINTPLSIISLNESLMQDMLQKENFNRDQFSRMLSKIEETVAKISKITQALRAYAVDNSSSSSEAAEFKPVSITSVIDSALLFCEHRLQQSGITLSPFNLPDSVKVECRSQQLSQAIYNLILNASEAIENLPEKWIRIESVDTTNSVLISVTDSGAGISRENRDKVFDPFYTTKHAGKGSGLGLSLCKGIIDIHQGKIMVDPKSKNTKFVIELPKVRNKAEKIAA